MIENELCTHEDGWITCEDDLFYDFIFIYDPFQANTLAVFESIYRYGRHFYK